MKKLLYILCFILFFAACKYEKTELSFNRHYNIYTFLTQRGAAKYFCAKPDTTLAARDEYAIVKGEVTYLSLAKDSILVYGHCWSKSRDFKYDKRYSTFNMIDEDVDTVPDEPIFEGSILALGKTFESVMPYLTPETDYYVKSYIITGSVIGGVPKYRDTAYNQTITKVTTQKPSNEWKARRSFPDDKGSKGGISFTYKNKIYAGLGYNGSSTNRAIYVYDPLLPDGEASWTKFIEVPYTITEAVCFVLENVKITGGATKNYLYIGGGTSIGGDYTKGLFDFYRWDLDDPQGGHVPFQENSSFGVSGGGARSNMVAFTYKNKAYVGGGISKNGTILGSFYMFDPEYVELPDEEGKYTEGKWTPLIEQLPVPLSSASVFMADGYPYIVGGTMPDGQYSNHLYKFSPNSSGDGLGAWEKKIDFPGTPRTEAVGVTIENYGYFGLGIDKDSLRSDFWRFNPYTQIWDKKANFKGAARYMGISGGIKYAENDYRGYVGLGGETGTAIYHSDFFQYRP